MTTLTTAERLLESMTDDERRRAAVVEEILPAVRDAAAEADARGEFPDHHLKMFSESGLLGLGRPRGVRRHGRNAARPRGHDVRARDGLRLDRACVLLPLLVVLARAAPARGHRRRPLHRRRDPGRTRLRREGADPDGHERAPGSATSPRRRSRPATRTCSSRPRRRPPTGGWLLNGTKSFGCLTGSADYYLVTARLAGLDGMDSLALFLVDRRSGGRAQPAGLERPGHAGLRQPRHRPGGLFVRGRRGADHPRWLRPRHPGVARVVGRQPGRHRHDLRRASPAVPTSSRSTAPWARRSPTPALPSRRARCTRCSIGQAETALEEAHLWARRQLLLESSEPPLLPKPEVVKTWRMSKGAVCERSYDVVTHALKMCGTSGALAGQRDRPGAPGCRDGPGPGLPGGARDSSTWRRWSSRTRAGTGSPPSSRPRKPRASSDPRPRPSALVEVPRLRQLDRRCTGASRAVDLGVDLENPNTGLTSPGSWRATDADVDAAAAAAAPRARSPERGASCSAEERAAVLEQVADALDTEAMRIAALESLGTGAVIGTTAMLAVVINGGAFRLAAAQLRDGALQPDDAGPDRP